MNTTQLAAIQAAKTQTVQFKDFIFLKDEDKIVPTTSTREDDRTKADWTKTLAGDLDITQAKARDLINAYQCLDRWYREILPSTNSRGRYQPRDFPLLTTKAQVVAKLWHGRLGHSYTRRITRKAIKAFVDRRWEFTLADLADRRKRNKLELERLRVEEAFRGSYRSCNFRRVEGGGHHEFKVFIGPKVRIDSEPEITYCGKGWSTHHSVHHFHVRPDWIETVQDQEMAVVDCMLTLDITPLDVEDGITLFRATWVRQGRGTTLVQEEGFIAVDGTFDGHWHQDEDLEGIAAHGSTKRAAKMNVRKRKRRGIIRLAELEEVRAERAERAASETTAMQAKREARLDRWLAEVGPETIVRISDSLSIGNCKSGTLDWVEKHAKGRGSMTVGEFVGLLKDVTDRRGMAESVLRHIVVRRRLQVRGAQ